MVFLLAMLHNPASMKKAQEELDSVIGRDRLPTFDDRANLPYINALIKELYRWQPLFRIGIPHANLENSYVGGRLCLPLLIAFGYLPFV